MIKKLLLFFLITSLGICCVEKQRVPQSNSDLLVEQGTFLYNNDSTFFVFQKKDSLNLPGVSVEFNVIKTSTNKAVFTDNGEYSIIKWENDSLLLLRRVLGIQIDNSKQLGKKSVKSNEYILNVYNLNLYQRNLLQK